MYPENLAKTLKVIGKIRKNAQSLPFDRRSVFTTFQKFSSHGRLTIKCLTWTRNTHISTMPPKKKPRRDISGLKNQPKLTTDPSHTNEPMSCASDTAAPPMSSDPQIDNDADDEEWTPNLGSKRDSSKLSKSAASMWAAFAPNAHQSVRLRTMIAAWRAFSVNKMTLPTKFPCSKVWFGRLAMNVFSYPSSTANSILSRWWVQFFLIN